MSTHADAAEHTNETLADRFPKAVDVIRWVTAIIAAGTLGAFFWLTIMQEGNAGRIFNRRWTEHDFPDGLGAALGATEHARVGLVATVVLGIAVTVLFALIERFLPGRNWVKGISFAPILFLAWGLLFAPFVNSHQVLQGDDYAYLSDTVFATRSGNWTLLSAAAASLAAGIVIARVLQLVRSADWWTPKDPEQYQSLLESTPLDLPSIAANQDERAISSETETPQALFDPTDVRPGASGDRRP